MIHSFALKFQGTVKGTVFPRENEILIFSRDGEKSVLRSRLGKLTIWKRLNLAMTLQKNVVVKSRVRDSKERRRRRRPTTFRNYDL